MELSEELSVVSKPIYEDELLETLHIAPYHSDLIPGSFAFCHVNQMAAKARIIKALELGFNHLRCNKLKVLAKLTHTILRKPRIHQVNAQLEDSFKNFRVVHDFEEIKGVAPNPDVLASIEKKLTLLREEAGDYLVEQGMAIPRRTPENQPKCIILSSQDLPGFFFASRRPNLPRFHHIDGCRVQISPDFDIYIRKMPEKCPKTLFSPCTIGPLTSVSNKLWAAIWII